MKRVFLFITTITVIAGGFFAYTLWKLPPENDQGTIIIFNLVTFITSATICITGIFTFFWYLVRRVFFRTDSPRIILRTALREGFFVALFANLFLLLQKIEAITIINLVLLTLFFISLDLYLEIKNKEKLNSEN